MDERLHTSSLRLGLLPLLLFAAIVAACNTGNDSRIEQVTVDLEEVNNSGFSGSALLATAGSGEISIVIAMGHEDELGGDFPVAVNQGTCDDLSSPQLFDLDSLSNGTLHAQVRGDLSELRERDHSIVVFSSAERLLYVACGDF